MIDLIETHDGCIDSLSRYNNQPNMTTATYQSNNIHNSRVNCEVWASNINYNYLNKCTQDTKLDLQIHLIINLWLIVDYTINRLEAS